MSQKPIDIPRYIQITVKNPLEIKQRKFWLASAKSAAPSGTIATIQTTDDKGVLRNVAMVHKELKRSHAYLIPLTRDLLPEEIQKIVEMYAAFEPDLDFDVETNEVAINPFEENSIPIGDKLHLDICTALAKKKHAKWMKERLDSGWRYGIKFSTKDKTSPLLRPWEQLPDRFKQPDLDTPQEILDIIKDQGYFIIASDKLDRVLKKS